MLLHITEPVSLLYVRNSFLFRAIFMQVDLSLLSIGYS